MNQDRATVSHADRIDMTPGTRRLSLAAMMMSAFIAGISFGVFVSMLSVILESWGVGSTVIGLNSAMPILGIIVASPFLPAVLRRLGTLRTIYAGLGIEVVALLLLPTFPDVGAWFVIRFVAGLGIAAQWIISETWVNTVAVEKHRGLTIGLFTGLLGGGFAIGPLIIVAVGIEGYTPFIIAAALALGSGLPLLFARKVAPRIDIERAKNLRWVLKIAPVIMVVAVISGIGDEAIFALLPVYGIHSGLSQDDAIFMLAVFVAGTVFLQIPIGWIADRIGRRIVLLFCATIGFIGPVVMPFVIANTTGLYITLFIWGGTVWGVYSLAITLLGERFRPSEIAQASALFVMIYSAGSLVGPPIGGAAMDLWNPHGLPVAVGAALFLLVVIASIAWLTGAERNRDEAPPAD
jgi:MFS family permease